METKPSHEKPEPSGKEKRRSGELFKIYFPTMKSSYAAAAIFAFMANWNNFLWPLVILQSQENKTITLMISSLSSAYVPDYGVIMMAIIFGIFPTMIIVFFMQKYFVEGMVGSIK